MGLRMCLPIGIARHSIYRLPRSFDVGSQMVDGGADIDEAIGDSLPIIRVIDQVFEASRQGLLHTPNIPKVGR